MGKIAKYTRRGFLGLGIAAAGGLAVGYYYYKKPYPNPLEGGLAEGDYTFNPYVIINTDNSITIITPRAEMGQGIHTTLAALVAEELDVEMSQITAEHGPAAAAYYNGAVLREGAPFAAFEDGFLVETARDAMEVAGKLLALQVTGGSSASIDAFDKMRQAGAAARAALLAAASRRWGVEVSKLRTEAGAVLHPDADGRLPYGVLVKDAHDHELFDDVPLKDPSEWKILGKSQRRVELREKVTGGRIFGIDVQLPDMLYATVAMSPRFGAKAVRADKTAALAVEGVQDVIEIDTTTGSGFGIIASNTWAAFEGALALAPEWGAAAYPDDSAGLKALFTRALEGEESFTLGGSGDPAAVLAGADVLEAHYSVPFLAHSTMEPMNATAQFVDGKLTLWLGTQAPGIAATVTAGLLGIETEDVEVITTRLGGGFGRRAEVDVPLYAAAIAAKTGGKPVKVTWSREEDTRHDTYRPMAEVHLRGSLKDGAAEALDYRIASPSINKSLFARTFPSLSAMGPDRTMLDGAFDQPYSWPNSRYAAHRVDVDIPVGFWRSVGHSINGFAHESFIDELAAKAGQDPLTMRLAMMQDPRFAPARAALETAAEMAEWGKTLPAGVGQGIAHGLSFGTWVAEVVQVDMRGGSVKLDHIWAAADPGLVLDPANFEAQISSAIIYGLSAAVGQEITFADGQVEQENFYDYDALRMAGVPPITVQLLENAPKMGGAGEPGTPPVAAALGNAIFATSGQRLRALPFGNAVEFDLG